MLNESSNYLKILYFLFIHVQKEANYYFIGFVTLEILLLCFEEVYLTLVRAFYPTFYQRY